MPAFVYKAVDTSGRTREGRVEASDEAQARSKLDRIGYLVNSITLDRGAERKKSFKDISFEIKLFRSVRLAELSIFTRLLSVLLNANVTLLRALELIGLQEKQKYLKEIILDLCDTIRSGGNFSEGLGKYPKVFSSTYVGMVQAGEASGRLGIVLKRLAEFQEKEVKIRKRVKSALVYPAVVLSITAIIVGGMMTFVVPKFQEIFESMLGVGTQLPGLTRGLISVSEGFQNHPLLILGGFLLFIFGFKFFKSTLWGKLVWERFLLFMPKFGTLIVQASVSRMARTMGALMSSGVKILTAMDIVSKLVESATVSKAISVARDRVRDGESFSMAVSKENIFPSVLSGMVQVGEETGELPQMLDCLADMYDEDVDNTISGMVALLEPLMIVVLAGTVGTIVLALFMPMVELMQNLR